MDAAIIMWALGLLIGLIFGAAWGYAAGSKSVAVITLPAQTDEPPT